MDRASYKPSALAQVDSHPSGDRWTLVLVRELKHSNEDVWNLLTDPEQLSKWAPFTADRDLGKEGKATLMMLDADNQQDMPSTVRKADAVTQLEYTWGPALVQWDLVPTESGTVLTLSQTVDDKEMLPKLAAGWHICLDVARYLLDGDPIRPIRGEEAMKFGWQKLHDKYADKLGITVTK